MTGELRDVTLTVNGKVHRLCVEPRLLLVHALRRNLGLTGAHIGCETAQCGACTVLLNGDAVKSCNLLAMQADGGTLLTIEGVANNGHLHPIQAAFHERQAVQCGFCTPGMIMFAHDLLEQCPCPTEDDVRRMLHGNLCRCTGYQHIVEAIQRAGELISSGERSR
jgi:aerobic carbon-monoxide dehydrogenase small subunit